MYRIQTNLHCIVRTVTKENCLLISYAAKMMIMIHPDSPPSFHNPTVEIPSHLHLLIHSSCILIFYITPPSAEMSSCWKPYNFYVFITHDNMKQNSLRIPNEFSREEWKQILTKNIILTESDDKTWPMIWMISDKNQLWLQNGWPEFAKHYHLKIGHLLLFNHQGNSTFHVRIFGRNSREINYFPLTKVRESETKIDQSVLQEMEVIFKSVPEHKSANPSFSVTLGVTYLKASRLHLPISFCRKYLTAKTKCVDCVLQTPDGGTWGPVNCKDSESCGVLCGKNWKNFSDENHLKVGDVCVFELKNEIKKELKVTIIRA